MKQWSAVLFMFFSVSVYAGDFTVDKVNEDGTRAVVKTSGSSLLYMGDTLQVTDEFEETCRGSVIKVDAKSVVIDISGCKNAKAVKPGVEMTKGAPMKAEAVAHAPQAQGLRTPNEDWYFLFGFGGSNIRYSDEALNDSLDAVDSDPEVDRFESSANIAFYWPKVGYKSMHGVSSFAITDNLDAPGIEFSITQSFLTYSFQQYFGTNIGDGWFYRLDGGLARFSVDVNSAVLSGEDSTDFGLGFLAGGGYSWPIGTDTRIQLGGHISYLRAEGEAATSTSWYLSWLF